MTRKRLFSTLDSQLNHRKLARESLVWETQQLVVTFPPGLYLI